MTQARIEELEMVNGWVERTPARRMGQLFELGPPVSSMSSRDASPVLGTISVADGGSAVV